MVDQGTMRRMAQIGITCVPEVGGFAPEIRSFVPEISGFETEISDQVASAPKNHVAVKTYPERTSVA